MEHVTQRVSGVSISVGGCKIGGINMDKKLIDTKHFTLYLSTLQIGLSIEFVTEHKELIIHLIILEINIR